MSSNNESSLKEFELNDSIYYMKLALKEAYLALESDEVPVGCIFVDNNNKSILISGYNQTNKMKNATKHCEIICIDKLYEKYQNNLNYNNIILYVTVEPCIMCATALNIIGINTVYYGAQNNRFGGCGSVLNVNTILNNNTIYKCIGGILSEESINLLKQFYSKGNPSAPPEKRHRPLLSTQNNSHNNDNNNITSTEIDIIRTIENENKNTFTI